MKYRIERKMIQMRMLVSSVVVEVDEIFNVVMRTYKFNILERRKTRPVYSLRTMLIKNTTSSQGCPSLFLREEHWVEVEVKKTNQYCKLGVWWPLMI